MPLFYTKKYQIGTHNVHNQFYAWPKLIKHEKTFNENCHKQEISTCSQTTLLYIKMVFIDASNLIKIVNPVIHTSSLSII